MTTVLSSNGRPLSRCAECSQVDDHPKHMVMYPEPLGVVQRHFDCCPPDECAQHAAAGGHLSCADTLATAGGKKGMDLVEHITNTAHITGGSV